MGHPLLLGGVAAAIATTIRADLPLGPAWLAILAGLLACLFLLERRVPFREDWRPNAREWWRDGLYFAANGLTGASVTAGAGLLALHFARDRSGLPLAAEIPLGFALSTLIGYWTHRLGHQVGWLWHLHGIHHAPAKVNAWNNNVFHFLDLAFQSAGSLLVLLLLGFSQPAIFAVSSFAQALGFAAHANVDFRIGGLNYLIVSPEQHRLHHSRDLAEAGHYAVLPFWDLAFGTFTWRQGREPRAVGIDAPSGFPDPDSIASGVLHPLRVWSRRRAL